MISDKKQIQKLEAVVQLITDVLSGNTSHKNQSVYLSVAADYCREVLETERRKAEIDDET